MLFLSSQPPTPGPRRRGSGHLRLVHTTHAARGHRGGPGQLNHCCFPTRHRCLSCPGTTIRYSNPYHFRACSLYSRRPSPPAAHIYRRQRTLIPRSRLRLQAVQLPRHMRLRLLAIGREGRQRARTPKRSAEAAVEVAQGDHRKLLAPP